MLNSDQRKKARNLLLELGDERDAKEVSILESADLKETLTGSQQEIRTLVTKLHNLYLESFKEFQTQLLRGLVELTKVVKDQRQQDWSGFFKDFPTLLSQIGDNTKGTNDIIRNLKWNASQQLRDVNGSPINPAIAGFGITTTYDDVVLAYTGSNLTGVTYKQNGQIKAVLTLTYDGSSNLTEVSRTQ